MSFILANLTSVYSMLSLTKQGHSVSPSGLKTGNCAPTWALPYSMTKEHIAAKLHIKDQVLFSKPYKFSLQFAK